MDYFTVKENAPFGIWYQSQDLNRRQLFFNIMQSLGQSQSTYARTWQPTVISYDKGMETVEDI